jgi:hypothetical protein
VNGAASASVQVRGVYTGALTLQGTVDDSVWVSFTTSPFYRPASGATASTITSADTNIHTFSTYNIKKIRITGLAAMTGTASVFISGNKSPNQVIVSNTSGSAVNIQGTVTSSGAATEDAASSNGQGTVSISVVRSDTLSSATTSANGDIMQPAGTKTGAIIVKDEMTHRVTYRATSGSFTPAASATDIFTITGVASKTIMITKIIFSATQTTGGTFNVSLIKRSTANTSGTAQDMTAVPLDASDAAAGSTVRYYTANPTLGTTIASIETVPIFCSATTAQPEKYEFNFGENGKPVILNSAAQSLSLNFGGVTMTGGACFVTIEWTETW